MTKTSLREQLQRPELVAAAVLLSLAVIPVLPMLLSSLAVPLILLAAIGIRQAHRADNLLLTGLVGAATVVVLVASFLIADQLSAGVRESGDLQGDVLLTSAAVLAGLAGLIILLSGQKVGVLGLLAAGALRLGADCLIAAQHAQDNPVGEDWASFSDVVGAMVFGVGGGILAAIAALVVFRRVQNSTVRSVATWDSPSRW